VNPQPRNAQQRLLQPLTGKQVLVADPNPVTRTVLRDTCYALGAANVNYCTTAADVLRAVSGHEVQVILCEFRLDQHRDGQQLLEELRAKRLIRLSTVFMMVTTERAYRQVVSVADFAPDDYLIKPFTQDQLRTRLIRANEKKLVLARAHQLIESDARDLAVHECKRIAAENPRFFADATRLAVDVLGSLERFDEAEVLLDKVLAVRPVPWALMALAVIRRKQHRLEEAEEILHGLIANCKEMLSAYDMLAAVKEELGKDDEALDVLESATALSAANVERLRRTGAVAHRVGKLDRAEQVFSKVVERVRDSSLLEGSDFSNLSQALIAQGKTEAVRAVLVDQRKLMRGHPDGEFVTKLIEYQHAEREQDIAGAKAALDRLLELLQPEQPPVPLTMQIQVVEACYAQSRNDAAEALAKQIAAVPDADRRVVARAQALIAAHRVAPEPPLPTLDLDGIHKALDRLSHQGWRNDIAERVFAAIMRGLRGAEEGSEAQGRFAVLLDRYEALKANYGIVRDTIEN